MRIRELAFDIGRTIGKRPAASWIFCLSERALPLHRLARSRRCVAFCHPRPIARPHVLVVPTTPFPSLAHARTANDKKVALLWEMLQLAREVTADHDADWRLVINGGTRQDIGQVHGHLMYDDLEVPTHSIDIDDPTVHPHGWEQLLHSIETAHRIQNNGYSVTFRFQSSGGVVASFSESHASET